MVEITLTVTYFAVLLGFGVLIANLLKKARIPDTFFLLIFGLIMGPTIFGSAWMLQYVSVSLVDVSKMGAIPDFLRVLALILIVFLGTFNLSFRVFKKFSSVSIKLALIGVLFNTAFLGIAAHFIFNIDWLYSFLISAVISGTGTGVLFAFQDALKHSKKALHILTVESIFNTPLCVILPILFLDLIALQPGALIEPLKYASQFWQMIAAGVGTGLLIGLAVASIMKRMLREYSVLLLFSISLITYALAELVGGSGMLAVAICGLIAGNMVFPYKKDIKRFDDHLSEMLRISVFTLLGAQVALFITMQEFVMALVFFFIIFFSRALFVVPLVYHMKGELNKKEILFLNFVAPRGLASAAIAPIVVSTIITAGGGMEPFVTIANSMMNVIFLVILFSILFSTMVASLIGHFTKDEEYSRVPKGERLIERAEKSEERKRVFGEEEMLERAERDKSEKKAHQKRKRK